MPRTPRPRFFRALSFPRTPRFLLAVFGGANSSICVRDSVRGDPKNVRSVACMRRPSLERSIFPHRTLAVPRRGVSRRGDVRA